MGEARQKIKQHNQTPQKSLRIMGIDPGSHKTGVGLVTCSGSEIRYLHHQLLKAPAKDLGVRIHSIFNELQILMQKYQPDIVVVESVFLGKNADSAFKLGHARGVCLLAAQGIQAKTLEISAREVKKILTGSGAAQKEQVRDQVCRWLRVQLDEKEMDVSDALSLAIAGSFEYEKRLRMSTLTQGWDGEAP